MGFTTGFTGGVTLTLGIAYLTILSHQRNREAQALYLRSQSHLLNSLVEPTPLYPQSRTEIDRQSHSSFTENAKERWNAEVENAVQLLQTTDWNRAREGMEGAVARMLGFGLQKSQEGIEEAEKKAGSIIAETLDRSKAATNKTLKQTAADLGQVSEARGEGVKEGLKQFPGKAKDIASTTKVGATRAVLEVKEGAVTATESQAFNRNAGTVDAARGAVRNAIGRGIEKGKQAIDKAQEAVGSVTSKIESASKSIGTTQDLSPVENALRERYGKHYQQDKTVEEMLEERYKPIDQRDNRVLRGV